MDNTESHAEFLNRCLIGEQLGSVIFVQDYLQLNFDGRIFTCNFWPRVTISGQSYEFGDQEYRDKLCEVIPHIVKKVLFEENKFIKIIFDNKSEIEILIGIGTKEVPESALFFSDRKGEEFEWSYYN